MSLVREERTLDSKNFSAAQGRGPPRAPGSVVGPPGGKASVRALWGDGPHLRAVMPEGSMMHSFWCGQGSRVHSGVLPPELMS